MRNKLMMLLCLVAVAKHGFTQEIKFGKVSKEEVLQKSHEKDSTANAAFLFNKRRTHYRYSNSEGFYLINEIHKRIKIYNKEALDKANFRIMLFNASGNREKIKSIKGYTFNYLDDKVTKVKLKKEHRFNEEITDNLTAVKIAFPEVKEGSIIDLKYTTTSPYISNIDPVQFQYDIPVNKLEVTIEAPEYFNFKKASKGYYSVPVTKSTRNGTIHLVDEYRDEFGVTKRGSSYDQDLKFNIDKFNADNIPALKDDEPFVANIANYRGGIKYELSYVKYPNGSPRFYATTWEDVSKRIYKYKSFGGELEKSGYYKKDLATVLSTTTNDYEKAGAIFQLVKSKVKWNGNYRTTAEFGVKKAYKEGVGNVADINLMLTSMLRSAGLNANPVLVSSRSNGIPVFPTIDGFNYVISMIEFSDGKYVLLDATEPYSIPNLLPIRALNWNGRKVTRAGASSWVKLTSSTHSTRENNIKVKIEDESELSGYIMQNSTRFDALLDRKRFNHIQKEDLISKFEELYDIEIEEFKSRNEKNLGKKLSRMIKFSSDNLIEEVNSKLYINPLLFLTQKENPFKSEDRKFPIEFATPRKIKNNISIQIPEGYQVEFVPEQLAIGLPEGLGLFKFKATATEKGVQISSILQLNQAMISPIYYQATKEFYKQIVAKQMEKIVLSKK
ncbi:DUF3857 domain-containing protein [uncultured Tenacibaculum sp.]|uniref:DUF3857 domain-containing protein n=1 Tax=uncultured Tenacibaculum sp. TaxID=174713 RepID=UPI0026055372|nr:DUF3857 domain-containing protein [uncultured Tenacibaculum sp.]